MFFSTSNSWLIAILPTLIFATPIATSPSNKTSPNLPVEVIHQFPKGTWIENLVVRPSGSALAIEYSAPNIYDVPISANSTPKLIHTFSNFTGVSGIAESSIHDTYFAMTGNFSFANFSAIAGSYAIHRIAFDKCSDKAVITQLATLPSLTMPNGIITIPGTPYVLIAESIGGFIYRFDTEKLILTTYLDDPLLKPSGTSLQGGVNGVKFSRGYLYFSNTNQELVARIRVSGPDATPQGKPEIVASQTLVDDFIVNDFNGDIFTVGAGTAGLAFVSAKANSTVAVTLVGAPGSVALSGATAAVWAKGQEGRTLLVSSDGGVVQYISGNITAGGAVSLVRVGGKQ